MKKELPLCLENSIPTECWSFYRFAIIEAYPLPKIYIGFRYPLWYMPLILQGNYKKSHSFPQKKSAGIFIPFPMQ